jgi:translation initiation factor 4A
VNISGKEDGVQALIVAPTRELASDIDEIIQAFGAKMGIKTYLACPPERGVRSQQQENIPEGVHVVTGTLGSISGLISRGVLSTDKLMTFILDKTDERWGGRSIDKRIADLFNTLPQNVQVGIFFDRQLNHSRLTDVFPKKLFNVGIKTEELSLRRCQHFYVDCKKEELKYDALCNIFATFNSKQAVVYCNSRKWGGSPRS